jgi:hypothetical protein
MHCSTTSHGGDVYRRGAADRTCWTVFGDPRPSGVVTAEPSVDHRDVAAGLAEELRLMADWLELDKVVVDGKGDLAPALERAL